MHNCYSTTYPNYSPFQAWRAGFREGVKMCLDRGRLPTLVEFGEKVRGRNYDNLCIWQSAGADIENGDWAIYGARLGTYMVMLDGWDYKKVQWFDNLAELWEEIQHHDVSSKSPPLGEILRRRLTLPIADLTPDASRFFKHHYGKMHRNVDINTTEMSVIRKMEGW